MSGILLYGDPHGVWDPLLAECGRERPDAVILLGDCELDVPLRERLAPVFAAGVPVLWIPGNHDCRDGAAYDRLWGDHWSGNLHGRSQRLAGLVVAGLGGVFRERVWYPRQRQTDPVIASRRAYLRSVLPRDRWRGGLPLRVRDTIFPEDATAVAGGRADLLVTHEAPTSHPHGFAAIDELAEACRARLVIHGHHHEAYEGTTCSGIAVRGLAATEPFRLRPEDLR